MMGCCGEGRAALRADSAAAPARRQHAQAGFPAQAAAAAPVPRTGGADAEPSAGAGVTARVRYTERARVRVRGAATGRDYEFSGEAPLRAVDARDADALVRTGFFR